MVYFHLFGSTFCFFGSTFLDADPVPEKNIIIIDIVSAVYDRYHELVFGYIIMVYDDKYHELAYEYHDNSV